MTTRLYVIQTKLSGARALSRTQPAVQFIPFGQDGASAAYYLWATTTHGNTSGASEPAPAGTGCEWTTTALAGSHFLAGTWSLRLRLRGSKARSGTLIARFYRRNGSTYTLIGTLSGTVNLTTTVAAHTLTGSLAASGKFGATTRLYVDFCHHCAATGTTSTVTLSIGTSYVTVPEFSAQTPADPAHLELTESLNLLAGTKGLCAQNAANVWAGVTGWDLLGALNIKNGTVGLGLNDVCNQLAGTTNWDAPGALTILAHA